MKHIIIAFMLMFSMHAFAISSHDMDVAGFDKLSATQKAEMIAQIEQKTKDLPTVAAAETADKVEKWVNIGSQIGKGLAGAAKELGVAANDFAKTPVGILATWLIIYHFIGNAFIHVIGGLLIWAVGLSLTYALMRRSQEVTEKYDPTSGKKISVVRKALAGEDIVMWWFANGVIMIAGIITMFSW